MIWLFLLVCSPSNAQPSERLDSRVSHQNRYLTPLGFIVNLFGEPDVPSSTDVDGTDISSSVAQPTFRIYSLNRCAVISRVSMSTFRATYSYLVTMALGADAI